MMYKTKERKHLRNYRIPVWPFLCIIFIIASEMLFIVFLAARSLNNDGNLRVNVDTLAESSLISSGLAIVGMAIAVWTGLNIANAIDKREIDAMSVQLFELQSTMEKTNVSINTTEESASALKDQQQKIGYEAFLQEILKTSDDLVSRYFYSKFFECSYNKETSYINLLQVEQCFEQVYSMHNSNYSNNVNLIEKSIQGEEIIDKEIKGKIKSELVEFYLLYRKADFIFYRSFCLKEDDKIELFILVADKYIGYCKKFAVNIPLYIQEVSYEYYKYNEGVEKLAISIYCLNSIGVALIKAAAAAAESESKNEKRINSAKKAVFYCGFAVKWSDGSKFSNEVFYRNFGCALEWLTRLNKNKASENEKIYTKIIDNYEKAYYWMVKNANTIKAKQIESVYHVLLSYYERYLQYYICIDYDMENIETLENIIIQANEKTGDKIENIANKYYTISEKAKTMLPQCAMYESLHGFAAFWLIILNYCKNKETRKPCENSENSYIAEMEFAIQNLEVMGISDDYSKILIERLDFTKKKLFNQETHINS